jgi:undecaprenyl-diphosphatase
VARWLPARAFLVVTALAVGVNDGVVSKTLKRLADRPRPHQALNGVRMIDLGKASFRPLALLKPLRSKTSRASTQDVDGRSFPSSHTMNTLGAALVCAAFYRRRGWLAFGPALLVAYSRIYTGSHWPTDIAGSLLLAVGSTLLLLALAQFAWKRAGARLLPETHRAQPLLFAQ